ELDLLAVGLGVVGLGRSLLPDLLLRLLFRVLVGHGVSPTPQKSSDDNSGTHARARSRAASQRSRRDGPDGETTVVGFHVAAMSCSSFHVPMASPARNAAPSVVASSTGETSTGR